MSRSTVFAALALLALAGCALGPDYKKPETATPVAFEEPGPWKTATPKDALPKGAWWKIFNDAALDTLETQATSTNNNVQAAIARRDQARAIAQLSHGDYFPQVYLDPNAQRSRFSGNRQTQTPATRQAYTANSYNVPFDLSYEIDLWGRVRRSNESVQALAQASDASYQNVLLGVQGDVAQTYFTLRSLFSERALVARSIDTRREALDLVRTRFSGGAAGELDVFRAGTELATAESDALTLDQRRNNLLHALAVLCGQMPEKFPFEDGAVTTAVSPALPVGLPSELLERRPDVAAAERTLAATNAQIGVAKAAFFPSIRLIGSAGYNSEELSSLLDWNSRQWSWGPSISVPIFQAGRGTANYERAKAVYAEAIANYRQRVLVAFQEVEDGLGNLHFLDDQSAVIARAVQSSRQAANLSTLRYKAGLVSYLEVVDAERTALQNERTASQLNNQRATATILLVKALGGGW